MSLYEKIATIIIAVLALTMLYVSYHEYKEPAQEEHASVPQSGFDQSMGQDFIIGSYNTIVSTSSSGGIEDNCTELQPVLAGTLHDIKERLEHAKTYNGTEDPFEVNEATLQLLCNKNVQITLGSNTSSSTLVLQKIPFKRIVPSNGSQDDIGTEVHIDATIVPVGGTVPAAPTTYGDQLIPDRFLDN